MSGSGVNGSLMPLPANAWRLSKIVQDAAVSRVFPPVVHQHLVKTACERPEAAGRSLSLWDCKEIARQLIAEGLVESISAETVRRVLARQRIKPWRYKMWLSGKVPRDAAFAACVLELSDLYTRDLRHDEVVVCADEKTSIQPRTRKAPTRPAAPNQPTTVEHEYERKGALNLIAGFDTRSGSVWGITVSRKRQVEFIEFLEKTERQFGEEIKTIHVVLDNVPMHRGKKVLAWLEKHPRFLFHSPPVHCSWMNQIEQWFSILQRKRLGIADFQSKEALGTALLTFITEWNEQAHAFHWSYRSFEKILLKCDQTVYFAAPPPGIHPLPRSEPFSDPLTESSAPLPLAA